MNFFKNRNNIITYTVNKAMNNHMYVSVQNGEVIINAPWYVTNSQIQKVIEEKKNWIKQKIKEYEQTQKECVLSQGETQNVKLLGEEYKLTVQYKNMKAPVLTVEKKEIMILLPNQYKKINNKEIIKILIDKMYDMVAKNEIEKVMEETRIAMGRAPEDYEVKRMEKEIARCNQLESKITIHPEIVKYHRDIVKYVILHEFCHLQYKNHTRSFYQMIETYMPNYEEYANELNGLKY